MVNAVVIDSLGRVVHYAPMGVVEQVEICPSPPIGTVVRLREDGQAEVHLHESSGVVLLNTRFTKEAEELLAQAMSRIIHPQTKAQALAAAVLLGDEEVSACALADWLQENVHDIFGRK